MFTLGIDKAADFIHQEFVSIGLETFEELDDYMQPFMGYSLQIQSRRVVLNGIEIPNEQTGADANAPSVHWVTGDPIEVVVIGPGEDAGQRIRAIYTSDRNTLVLMNTSHQAFFRRWADELSVAPPTYYLDPPSVSQHDQLSVPSMAYSEA